MQRFYFENNEWSIMDYQNAAPRSFHIIYDGVIDLTDNITIVDKIGKRIFSGSVTQIDKNSSGDKYATYDELKAVASTYNNLWATMLAGITSLFASIVTAISNKPVKQYDKVSTEFTRGTNNTYTANTAVSSVGGTFATQRLAVPANKVLRILRVVLRTDDTGFSGKKLNVHIYESEPSAFTADNAAFSIVYANAVKRVKGFPVIMGTGNMNGTTDNDYNTALVKSTDGYLYFVIETVDAATASANSTKWTVLVEYEITA